MESVKLVVRVSLSFLKKLVFVWSYLLFFIIIVQVFIKSTSGPIIIPRTVFNLAAGISLFIAAISTAHGYLLKK